MEKVKVIIGHEDEDCKRHGGFTIIDGRPYSTFLSYDEVEMTGQEIYNAINECKRVYTVDAIHNDETDLF